MYIPLGFAGQNSRADGTQGRGSVAVGRGVNSRLCPMAVHLPGNPVPITLQVFAVACCRMDDAGSRLAALAQIEYLTAGLLGAPVFAHFTAGPASVCRPNRRVLVGFVAMAFVVGLITERSPRTFSFPVYRGPCGGRGALYIRHRVARGMAHRLPAQRLRPGRAGPWAPRHL